MINKPYSCITCALHLHGCETQILFHRGGNQNSSAGKNEQLPFHENLYPEQIHSCDAYANIHTQDNQAVYRRYIQKHGNIIGGVEIMSLIKINGMKSLPQKIEKKRKNKG